ncbi:MAG: amino acid ABC transporter ATP-binding protein [Lachnospiraceae bacterium]|nr:amino acid ABC transporter ATP-binding protein [Lachnospiraceae bacterium]
MVDIRNVRKGFGKSEVLKDVSIQIEDGQVVVILGPSGSGKTTLLRCVSFLERADAGQFTIGNETVDLKKASKKQILQMRRKMAFVFQNYNLFANKNALENVMEGLVIGKKMAKKEACTKAMEALEWVGLSEKALFYPSQLSGGQQQRVGIARAVALNPEVILIDEQTSALDPELVGETLAVIRKVAEKGITMLVVTHEMAFAQDVADKVVFMDGGVVVEEGSPQQIFTKPKQERTRQFLSRIISLDPMYYI